MSEYFRILNRIESEERHCESAASRLAQTMGFSPVATEADQASLFGEAS